VPGRPALLACASRNSAADSGIRDEWGDIVVTAQSRQPARAGRANFRADRDQRKIDSLAATDLSKMDAMFPAWSSAAKQPSTKYGLRGI